MKRISEKQAFVGCDVSKETLDFALYVHGESVNKFPGIQTGNDAKGLAAMVKWLKKNGVDPRETVVAMEHTGYYSDFAGKWLAAKNIDYVMLSPLAVKRWAAPARSKTDVEDARIIADYVYTHREKLEPATPMPPEIARLRELKRVRALMVKSQSACRHALSTIDSAEARKALQATVTDLGARIKAIDAELAKAACATPELAANYALLLSISGIGPINAVNTIVATRNFTTIRDPRKYAKHICVAPLKDKSGKSVDNGCHVSPFGHRALKADLTCAAKSAKNHDPEMRVYYKRHAAKGKPHGKIMNAIKFKLICRMFAVVKRGSPYVPMARYAAAN